MWSPSSGHHVGEAGLGADRVVEPSEQGPGTGALPGPPVGRAHARGRGPAQDGPTGVEIVKLANRARIPVVPRAGGTRLNDGAVPLREGILVDVKRMNQIHEIDLADRTVTVGPGISMLKLNEELKRYGVLFPDTPASYPCSLVGGRIACSGFSLLGTRFGHTRDLVMSFEIVLPTGEIIRVGDGVARRSGSPPPGTTSSTCSWATRARSASSPRRPWSWCPGRRRSLRPSSPSTTSSRHRTVHGITTSGIATLAGTVLFDEKKVEYLRRDDEAFIPMPPWVNSIVATALYGTKAEVREASKLLMDLGRREGRPLHRRRDGRRGLGVQRPLRQPLHGRPQGRHRGADVLALRGRVGQLVGDPQGAGGVDRHRAEVHRQVRHLRQLGDVLLRARRTNRGATTSPRSTSASGRSGSTTRPGPAGSTSRPRSPR